MGDTHPIFQLFSIAHLRPWFSPSNVLPNWRPIETTKYLPSPWIALCMSNCLVWGLYNFRVPIGCCYGNNNKIKGVAKIELIMLINTI